MIRELLKEAVSVLQVLGYEPQIEEKGGKIVIYFHVNNGSESFLNRHKNVIAMLCGGYLSEFYYANDTQYIYINWECEGLQPDDDRYSCVVYEMNKATKYGSIEMFTSYPDRCERKILVSK